MLQTEIASPTFEPHRLADLRDALAATCVRQLLRMFGEELASRPPVIRAALARNDLAGAAAAAHSLKGAALSIGAIAVGEAAAELECALSGGGGGCRLHRALLRLDKGVTQSLAALPHVPGFAASQAA